MDIELVARTVHEINRLYCEALGDKSQKPWSEATQSQKKSILAGIETILKDPEISPKQLHEKWMKEKLRQGWSYGPKRDEVRKEHPNLLRYEDIPQSERSKDEIFGAVIKGLLLRED